MNPVTVNVDGQSFQIKTSIDEKYIHELAAEITKRIKAIKGAGHRKDQEFKTIAMVAISLLDELNTANETLTSTRENARQFATRMIAKIDALLANNIS